MVKSADASAQAYLVAAAYQHAEFVTGRSVGEHCGMPFSLFYTAHGDKLSFACSPLSSQSIPTFVKSANASAQAYMVAAAYQLVSRVQALMLRHAR